MERCMFDTLTICFAHNDDVEFMSTLLDKMNIEHTKEAEECSDLTQFSIKNYSKRVQLLIEDVFSRVMEVKNM